MVKLLVFDSHPVQYRVPVWQQLEKLLPGCIHVVYASDCSVRGHNNKDFGCTISWDEPMLSGYSHTILNCVEGEPLSSWKSLTGTGVSEIIRQLRPAAVLLTGLNYRFDLIAYINSLKNGIPVWLRCETQDQALQRSAFKSAVRSLLYRMAYGQLSRTFYIGELNRSHYLRHGLSSLKLKAARYGTTDRFELLTNAEKELMRMLCRSNACISPSRLVVGFSGKFISKKNPEILFHMLEYLPESIRRNLHLYFMGSGPLESSLKDLADSALRKYNTATFFAGFVNQSRLAAHYLCMDILALPSRRMGETWGLVANEALQAGCGVVLSSAAGCVADFEKWERVRVFKEGEASELAKQITALAAFSRSFDWAKHKLKSYSIHATADAIYREIKNL